MQKTRILSVRTIVLLIASVLAVTLCLTGTARAALAYFSPDYQAEFNTTQLEVSLSEEGPSDYSDGVAMIKDGGALLTWMDREDFSIVPGKTYKEVLSAVNTGDYEQYVRVVVKKYWMAPKKDASGELMYDEDGNPIMVKDNTINPELIQLKVADGWTPDPANKTDEQFVLYSTDVLGVNDSRAFIESLRIDPAIVMDGTAKEKKTVEGNTTYYTYTYILDGYSFNIEAEVDAVQTHSAPDAIKSVWGYSVSADQLS